MRPFSPQYLRTLNQSLRSTSLTQLRKAPIAKMSTVGDKGQLNIEATDIKTAPGVELREHTKTVVGSVLDLFAGRPSLAKLKLWTDDGVFQDPLTIAKGREQFEPQWYGLQTAFSEIERLSHEVTSAGNPIEMNLKTRYKVKGIGSEKTIDSKILIHMEGDKISKVEDKWDGKIPDGSIAQVSLSQLFSPFWWMHYVFCWFFWCWSFVWGTRIWRVSGRRSCLSRSIV